MQQQMGAGPAEGDPSGRASVLLERLAAAERQREKLAAALRENLRRRKAQLRARQPSGSGSPPEGGEGGG